VREATGLGLTLLALWLVLSGHTEPMLVGFGIALAGLVLWSLAAWRGW